MSIQVHCQILSRYEIAQIRLAVFRTVHFDSTLYNFEYHLFQEVKQIFIRFSLSAGQVYFIEVKAFAQFLYWWKGGVFS